MDREMTLDYIIEPIDLSFLADAFAEQYLKQAPPAPKAKELNAS